MTQPASKPVRVVELLASDLSPSGETFCPNPKAGMDLWNAHPRVYLNPAAGEQARCSYCGTVYRLKDGESVGHGH